MAADDLGGARGESGGGEPAAQREGDRDVVERAPRLHLIEEPEAALREGERLASRRARRTQDRRRLQPWIAAQAGVEARRERSDRAQLEEAAQRHGDAERPAQSRAKLGGEKRMETEREEVVVHAEPFTAEQRGHPLGEHLFGRRARRDVAGELGAALGGGQRPAVELAVRQPRQRRQDHHVGRHHRLRQPGRERRPDRARREVRPVCRHQVGSEARLAHPTGVQRRRHLDDPRQARERRLDLAELDAHAADLHLTVEAAQVLDCAVGAPASEVAAPVEARPRLRAPGVGDEALGGRLGAAEIAACEAGAADRDLAARPLRREPPALVEQMDAVVGDRPADRHHARPLRRPFRVAGGVDRRLGRPVEVDRCDAQTLERAGCELGR